MTVNISNSLGGESSSRIAVLSLRNIHTAVSRAGEYVFEDLIVSDLDEGSLLTPQSSSLSANVIKARNWLSKHGLLGSARNDTLTPVPLEHDVDMFFFSAALLPDISAVSSVPDWRKRSVMAICWIQEL